MKLFPYSIKGSIRETESPDAYNQREQPNCSNHVLAIYRYQQMYRHRFWWGGQGWTGMDVIID